eukprot:Rhum_TRINITY_DN16619_c0_g1::Rhum_TRINITY_DN16619_c0_g1_i1::g.163873::m.163873
MRLRLYDGSAGFSSDVGMGDKANLWCVRQDTKRKELEFNYSASPTRLVNTPHLRLLRMRGKMMLPVAVAGRSDRVKGVRLQTLEEEEARVWRAKYAALGCYTPSSGPTATAATSTTPTP